LVSYTNLLVLVFLTSFYLSFRTIFYQEKFSMLTLPSTYV